jgi:hypothetical protein
VQATFSVTSTSSFREEELRIERERERERERESVRLVGGQSETAIVGERDGTRALKSI